LSKKPLKNFWHNKNNPHTVLAWGLFYSVTITCSATDSAPFWGGCATTATSVCSARFCASYRKITERRVLAKLSIMRKYLFCLDDRLFIACSLILFYLAL
jgi:hypothetical protein